MSKRIFAILAGLTLTLGMFVGTVSAHQVTTIVGTVDCQGNGSSTVTGDVYGGVHLIVILGGTTIYDQAQNGTSVVQTWTIPITGATVDEVIVAKTSDGSQASGKLTLTGGPCSTSPSPPIITPLCLKSLQNTDEPPGYNEFNWTIVLPGVVQSGYGMEWSTSGSDWSGSIDWADQNDPVAGGGWSGPLVTTTYADNGGNTLWVRWANFPTVVAGPVVNDLGLCDKPTPTPTLVITEPPPVVTPTPVKSATPPPTSTAEIAKSIQDDPLPWGIGFAAFCGFLTFMVMLVKRQERKIFSRPSAR